MGKRLELRCMLADQYWIYNRGIRSQYLAKALDDDEVEMGKYELCTSTESVYVLWLKCKGESACQK